jgi:hypothetical protein
MLRRYKQTYRLLSLPIVIVACLSVLVACSTTKRLSPGETLYTGVNNFKINPTDNGRLPEDMVSQLKEAVNVAPNNPMPFMSPYMRTPFPIGLWVYNNWNDSAGGLRGWLYNHLVAQPVLVSDVRPEVRTKMMKQILDDNGYFGSTVSYNLDYSKHNSRKAGISYKLDVSRPYLIDSIIYINNDSSLLCHAIDSVARKVDCLQVGEKFAVDSLTAARTYIANRLRNRGYYYFRPEYIEFLADSTISPQSITLKMVLAASTPRLATLRYRTGKIQTTILRSSSKKSGTPDTVSTSKGNLIVMRPAHLRDNLVPSCITFRKGKLFSVRDMDRTQTRLSRLGIFKNIQLQPIPVDTSDNNPTLDMYITCQFDKPMEASIEVNATSKSNSYIGPGLTFGLSNSNIFGGAEKLSIQLNADYEWQTGRDRSSVFNSYEFGATGSLAFPRLLAPSFVPRTSRELNWTTISLSANILNRPNYFKMAKFDTGITYEWRATRNTVHQFTPFKLTYTKLISTTEEFDNIMVDNPAIALSFQSQFIPQLSYTYTLDKFLEKARVNGINFTATLTEAGNVFDGIWSLCGAKGEKKLFGTPYSQFVKGQAQLVYTRRLIQGLDHWLVSRVLIGAEHAYGNSSSVPYSEQFYIGGANSIRAFTVRSIGPGSYRAPSDQVNGYFDQTGTFKLELNSEYRFPIAGMLHGALFVDAGNIWLLKNDPARPGGQLKANTFLKDIALGTGFGIRFDMGMIVVRGDLGYGLHVPYENGSNHYFNIRFKDAFAFHLAIGYPF